ncbi:MAG TPA: hypothetical protein VFS44_12170 [Gemmatimonadaceae bacterium]|nr:hypothetical protein [Gemmatimonadaceae bacterium]
MRINWLVTALLLPAALGAQTSTVRASTELRATAGGVRLATINEGTPLATGSAANGWTAVTLDGWLQRGAIGGKRDTFAISAGTDGAILRASGDPHATPLARLAEGMGLERVGRHGDWVHVRRSAWVRSGSLAPAAGAAPRQAAAAPSESAAAAPAAPATAEPSASAGTLAVDHRTTLQLAPDGDAALAELSPRTRVVTLARERGWVRVQVEGWVRATDLAPVDTTVLTAISAADLRAEPDKYQGETVRWAVQKIALQTADPLRRGFAPDEPYLLARGPGKENSLLYLALPPSLVEQARRIEPLSTVLVTARVRAGRSEPSGVPLLDVVSIAQR